MTIETINLSDTLRIRIEYDNDAESPAEWDNVGEIAYSSHRIVLGTEAVSRERLDEISAGIESGELIGIPVYAYVHGGATIRAEYSNPFHCPWDSAQSGYVYCTREKAVEEFGKKRMTKKVRERTLECLRGEVETFARYLEGDVYGYVIERAVLGGWDELASCWGIYGLDATKEEAMAEALAVQAETA